MSQPRISIIVTSRAHGNPNHSLIKLLESLKENTSNPAILEVLVKYDSDDCDFPSVRNSIESGSYPFGVKFCIGLRGRGYIDIHNGYNLLLKMVSKSSLVVGAMADDFTVVKGWDDHVMRAQDKAGKFFIIHQRPHPFMRMTVEGIVTKLRKDPETRKFWMEADMFDASDLHIIDEAPLWSKSLLDVVKEFPVSFTDAWTLALEHVLWREYQINITQFLDEIVINRTTCEVDQPGHDRWHTDRKINFDFIKSDEFKQIVYDQAWGIHDCL